MVNNNLLFINIVIFYKIRVQVFNNSLKLEYCMKQIEPKDRDGWMKYSLAREAPKEKRLIEYQIEYRIRYEAAGTGVYYQNDGGIAEATRRVIVSGTSPEDAIINCSNLKRDITEGKVDEEFTRIRIREVGPASIQDRTRIEFAQRTEEYP